MAQRIVDPHRPDKGELLTTHVSPFGATIYMNKPALHKLIAELQMISEADPKECFEVHVGSLFSYFLDDDTLETPPVIYHDGLQELLNEKANSALAEEIVAGSVPENTSVSPFEVTIMHVSDNTLVKNAQIIRPDQSTRQR
jgi:hypothetical protein